MNLENEANYRDGAAATMQLVGPNEDGEYIVTAKRTKRGRSVQEVSMTFTHNGLAALVGCWRAALGEVRDE
ncbi:hypothetical protein [Lacticaseibacillus absianus]|uniref:hypothetical protein n=1 Tax=Lacticaseibacillus absianus TaxID=2729623 RepID=UPI0015CB6D02|nr:hypothetical protein [Lacticaseibacillus absianus]